MCYAVDHQPDRDEADTDIPVWVGIPSSIRPRIGDRVTENGRSYIVERVVRSTTRPGTLIAECWPTSWMGQEPTGIRLVGGGVQYRVRELLANL